MNQTLQSPDTIQLSLAAACIKLAVLSERFERAGATLAESLTGGEELGDLLKELGIAEGDRIAHETFRDIVLRAANGFFRDPKAAARELLNQLSNRKDCLTAATIN